jgi:hypothetical protein
MTGERFRIVTEHNFKPHDKTFVLNQDEAFRLLGIEAALYEREGWTVTRGHDTFVARLRHSTRIVSIRRATPMEDSQ